MATRFHPNFVKGLDGNKLKVGQDLVIKIDDKPLYIIGRLFKGRWPLRRLIQIEQTGTKQNPERNQITFEMKAYLGKGKFGPMKPGKYRVSCYGYFPGLGGKRWGDNFEIE